MGKGLSTNNVNTVISILQNSFRTAHLFWGLGTEFGYPPFDFYVAIATSLSRGFCYIRK